MIVDIISPNAGKRLFDVSDKLRYVKSEESLCVWVFCEACGRDYKFGERAIDFSDVPCCPSKNGSYECDGSEEVLVQVRDEKQLMDLRKKSKPRYPF